MDFYCASHKLVIELDGSQHYENEGAVSDRERDLALNQLGISVVRYSNNDHRMAKSIEDSIDFAAKRQVWQRMIL